MINDETCIQKSTRRTCGNIFQKCTMRTNQDGNHRVTLTALVHRIVEALDTVTDFLQWPRQGGIWKCTLVRSWAMEATFRSQHTLFEAVQALGASVLHGMRSLMRLAIATLRSLSFLARISVLDHRVRSHFGPRKRTKFHKKQHVAQLWEEPFMLCCSSSSTSVGYPDCGLFGKLMIHMHQSLDWWSFDMF